MSIQKSTVSAHFWPSDQMPSSRFDPHRNSVQNAMVGAFVALTATIFVPALLFDISGEFLAIRFFGPTPWSEKNVGHESWVMMHHGSLCIIDDQYHESFMTMNHCELPMIMPDDPWWMIIHHGWSSIMMDDAWWISSWHSFLIKGGFWKQGQTENSHLGSISEGVGKKQQQLFS